ncbi:MAG: hypothetical protein PHQ66_01980 [Candidatus Nanoarchaeia archaeon]|nr:hypothetical protein [Candidatus Nanoarchaeia archaeon]MDD5357859.1 hypothetical protein [Candidatus Nanoarchaeia archaeon]MDD5588778.1 hypothetical protein [Candidatus Nanoarchaeia archaeon]
MELEQRILEEALKGVNELEENTESTFKIDNLNNHEAACLVAIYLSNYDWKLEYGTLVVSKSKINQKK